MTNVAPTATVTSYAGITDLTTANGYTAGGSAIGTTAYSQTSGLATLTAANVVVTASGGSIGPFRYVFAYNVTASGHNGIGWWDYGSAVTLASGETFTDNFSSGILTVQ